MMKKTATLLLAILALMSVFSACSKSADTQTETTKAQTTASQEQYYDAKGNVYSSSLDVLFYDKDGNSYKLEVVEDYMPDYVNQSTGERLNGFQCYITEQGCLYFDEDNKLSLKDGSMSIYYDDSKNVYYDISTVSWDKNGNLIHQY
jgi:hypothetical protein